MESSIRKYRICVLGDIAVGKSSLIGSFIRNQFAENYSATLGVDFQSRTLYIDGKPVRLQLWDTAGQERFRALSTSYVRDSDAVIIVFDVSASNTFAAVDYWTNLIRKSVGVSVPIFLAANKIDLEEKREISEEIIKNKATELDLTPFEVSAKTGYNVKSMFKSIAATTLSQDMINAADNKSSETENSITVESTQEENKCAC